MFRVFCKKPPNCFHNGHSLFHGIMSLVMSLKSHHQPKVDVGLLRCSQFPCFELLVCVGLFHFGCELCHVCTNALFLFYGRQIPTTLVPGLCVAWGFCLFTFLLNSLLFCFSPNSLFQSVPLGASYREIGAWMFGGLQV